MMFERPRNSVYSDRGAEAVNICIFMSHNKYLVACEYQFIERVGLDARAYPCVAFFLNTLATIIEDILAVLYDSLISASSESEVNCGVGVFVAF